MPLKITIRILKVFANFCKGNDPELLLQYPLKNLSIVSSNTPTGPATVPIVRVFAGQVDRLMPGNASFHFLRFRRFYPFAQLRFVSHNDDHAIGFTYDVSLTPDYNVLDLGKTRDTAPNI